MVVVLFTFAACARFRPTFAGPSREIRILNQLDEPICAVLLGWAKPASTDAPYVNYLNSPRKGSSEVSLDTRLPPHASGTILLPTPSKFAPPGSFEVAVLGCDEKSADVIALLHAVSRDAAEVRVNK